MKQIVTKLLSIIILLNYSCIKDKKTNYYPNYLENIESKFNVEDSFNIKEPIKKNIKELFTKLNKSTPYFIIEDDSSINFVKLSFPKDGFYRSSNYLDINMDTIRFGKPYGIEKLDSILPLHYYNYGKLHYASKAPKQAFVIITVDTTARIKDLKKVFSKVLFSYKNQFR